MGRHIRKGVDYGGTVNQASMIMHGDKSVATELSEINSNLSNLDNKISNYSTTEKVVGTWIDGKPLYEKVITGTTSNANTDGFYSIGAEIDFAMIIDGSIHRTVGGFNHWIPINYYESTNFISRALIGNNDSSLAKNSLLVYVNENSLANKDFYAVVRYTKK